MITQVKISQSPEEAQALTLKTLNADPSIKSIMIDGPTDKRAIEALRDFALEYWLIIVEK